MANGSGAAVLGLLIGIILAAEAAGWGDDDGDGLALESDSAGDDTTTSAPAVPTSVDGGATARPLSGSEDNTVITVTDHSGRTVALAVPPAAGPDVAADVMQSLSDHHVRAAICADVADSRVHPLCDPRTTAVAIDVDGRQGVHSAASLGVTVDALSDQGFAEVRLEQ